MLRCESYPIWKSCRIIRFKWKQETYIQCEFHNGVIPNWHNGNMVLECLIINQQMIHSFNPILFGVSGVTYIILGGEWGMPYPCIF